MFDRQSGLDELAENQGLPKLHKNRDKRAEFRASNAQNRRFNAENGPFFQVDLLRNPAMGLTA